MRAPAGFAAAVVMLAASATSAWAARAELGPGVVAMYAGEPISEVDVAQEREAMGLRADSDGDRAAMREILVRRILAKKAREAGLDRAPDFAAQRKRSQEALLAQLYEKNIAVAPDEPSADDIATYISAHPEKFAQRKVYILRQVFAVLEDRTPERFAPLHDLKAVKALLQREGTDYQENVVSLDTASADPQLLKGLADLPKGEVFALPRANGFLFNEIGQTISLPVRGRIAASAAAAILKAQQAQEALRREMQSILAGEARSVIYAAPKKPPATEPR